LYERPRFEHFWLNQITHYLHKSFGIYLLSIRIFEFLHKVGAAKPPYYPVQDRQPDLMVCYLKSF